MNYLDLARTQVTGSIDDLKSLTNLTNLDLRNTQTSGNISDLKALTNLTSLDLYGTQVTGDIRDLKALTNLTSLHLYNTQTPITGDINVLSTTKCATISLKGGKFTGDIAILPDACKFISFSDDKGSAFTWGTRPSTAKIIAIEGNASLTNIDKMLQDQAQCQVGFISSDPSYYKTIEIAGNRTSASDAAVATLQEKGYTIKIAKA